MLECDQRELRLAASARLLSSLWHVALPLRSACSRAVSSASRRQSMLGGSGSRRFAGGAINCGASGFAAGDAAEQRARPSPSTLGLFGFLGASQEHRAQSGARAVAALSVPLAHEQLQTSRRGSARRARTAAAAAVRELPRLLPPERSPSGAPATIGPCAPCKCSTGARHCAENLYPFAP